MKYFLVLLFFLNSSLLYSQRYYNPLPSRLIEQLHILLPKDEARFKDCLYFFHYNSDPQPFHPFPFLHFFDSYFRSDFKNGLILQNDWPILISAYNYEQFTPNKKIFIGIRGLDWGIHKSTLTLEMKRMIDTKFKTDVMFMPDNFIFINKDQYDIYKDPVMSVCHGRTYRGETIGNTWPGFNDGGGWKLFNKFFKENDNLYIIGYSNGSTPRNQLIRTKQKWYVEDGNTDYFLRRYAMSHDFLDKATLHRIKGIVDIETNYDNINDLALFLLEYYINDSHANERIFYATCNLSNASIRNHIRLIKLFKMVGVENNRGIIRYMNPQKNIIIDVIANNYAPYYSGYYANLEGETSFTKNNSVKERAYYTHNSIIAYTINEFMKLK